MYFFIGRFDEPPHYQGPLHRHPNHVGFVYTFSNPIYKNRASPGCEHCRRKATDGTMSTGQVPITGAILARIRTNKIDGVDSIDRTDLVAEYLKKNLHWKITTVCLNYFSYAFLV